MSKKKRRKRRSTASIGEALETSVDQGFIRAVAVMGQQTMEHILKNDPKIRSLVERLVKQRLERTLRRLREEEQR